MNVYEYFENTKNAPPHDITKKFIKMEQEAGKAIDLGCGAGRDTVYLIKNNWNVLAIDREDVRDIIEEKLDKVEVKNFNFSCQNFENIYLKETNLIISNFSIPFCSRNYFDKFWNKIVTSISNGGYFVGNFFGINDSWVPIKNKMVFLSKEQVLDLFIDFEILYFKENEYDKKTAMGKIKHWHTFDVIAKKKEKIIQRVNKNEKIKCNSCF